MAKPLLKEFFISPSRDEADEIERDDSTSETTSSCCVAVPEMERSRLKLLGLTSEVAMYCLYVCVCIY
jgi:hypothetical protein